HDSAKHRTSSRIVAQELKKIARHAIQEEISRNHLAIEFLPLQQPHQNEEIGQLDSRLKKLGRLERYSKRRTHPGLGNRIGEGYPPEVLRRFAIAATGGETTYTAQRVAKRQAGGEGITSGERGHVALADIPGRGQITCNHPTGENPTSLQSAETENLPKMRAVIVPVIGDVENLGPKNSAQHHQDSQIPRIVPVDPLLF